MVLIATRLRPTCDLSDDALALARGVYEVIRPARTGGCAGGTRDDDAADS